MAVKALMLAALAVLAGCQSLQDRAAQAAKTKGEAEAHQAFPDLPAACTAKVGRVKPGGEPWVITMKRWDIVAENRDRQAADCAAWGADMKTRQSD